MKHIAFHTVTLIVALCFHAKVVAQDQHITLAAHMQGRVTMWDQREIKTWGFLPTTGISTQDLPSPTLVFKQGDSIRLNMDNASEMAHTIHLHGLDVDQQNDGVPLTSFTIQGWGYGSYYLRPKNAGTFLYHCHVETVIHLQMGMYGAIIVRPKAGDHFVYDDEHRFTKEYVWLTSEIDSKWHEQIFTNGRQPAMYNPDYFLINGKSGQQIDADTNTTLLANTGDTVLIRLANMGYLIHKYVFPASLNPVIIGSDGRKFSIPEYNDTVYVYPGERYAVLLKGGAESNTEVSVDFLDNYKKRKLNTQHIPVTFKNATNIAPNGQISFLYTLNIIPQNILIEFEDEGGYFIEMFNIAGVKVFSGKYREKNVKINTSRYKAGVYLLRINNNKSADTRIFNLL